MEISSSHQMYVFFLCFLCGLGCGAFFDFQRSIRKLVRAGKFRTAVEDIAFDVLCVSAAVFLGFYFNNGQMRYYQVLGAGSGALFYAAFLSRTVMLVLAKIYRFTARFIIIPFVKVVKATAFPIIKLFELIKKYIRKSKKTFSRILKGIKSRKKHLKKRMKML